MLRTVVSLSLVAIICSGCSKNSGAVGSTFPATHPQPTSSRSLQSAAGKLRFKVPDGWRDESSNSEMRAAQYVLPKAEGDGEDALLILFYFGQGQGGSAQANIDRWISQIKQPDGRSSKELAKTNTLTINGLQVNTVDLTGYYSGGMSPDSAPANKQSLYRLRAAVIDTPKGSYFVKLTGPEKTVGYWDHTYTEYLKSFEFR